MLPANTSPRFCVNEGYNVFDERLFSDDVSERACSDYVSSDKDSSCSSYDSSVGDVSEFTDEEDNDYDLNDLVDTRDGENHDDSPLGSLILANQDDHDVLQELSSTVQDSPPFLIANDPVVNNQVHIQYTLPNEVSFPEQDNILPVDSSTLFHF